MKSNGMLVRAMVIAMMLEDRKTEDAHAILDLAKEVVSKDLRRIPEEAHPLLTPETIVNLGEVS